MAENIITIFGTGWCGDCTRARRFFDKNNIDYKWVDVDSDEIGEEFVLSTNKGMRSVLTILFVDGSILVEPTDAGLQQKLGRVLSSN